MSVVSPRAAARLAVAAVVLVAAVVASRAAAGSRDAPAAPAAPSVETFDYDAGTVRFSGRLSTGAAKELRALDLADGDTALVVVVTGQDVLTCEDLGRQLRELRRAYGVDREVAVWGDSAGIDVLQRFLRRERIARAVFRPLPPSEVLSDGTAVWTPAAILVTRDGQIVEGVSHTLRSPNVRLRSFAQELTSLQRHSDPPPDGGGVP